MSQLSAEQIRIELEKVKEQVTALTGQQAMDYLRPPRGIFNDHVLAVSKASGYTNVFWSVAYKDWDVNSQKGPSYAYEQVIKQLHPGAVILLHTVSKDNAGALGAIIEEAKRQGYQFKSLDQMDTKSY